MSDRIVLICTVGGAHQPIVTAIRTLAPDLVCFVCTGRDAATSRPGSDRQVEGQGMVVKASPEDPSPTLPNIPTQAGLGPEAFEVVRVPADDLDAAFSTIREAVRGLCERFPEARLVADYTGGTKTMTAALVEAALEWPDVDLQLVTGARADLVKVRDGTQRSAPASMDSIRLGRAMAPFLEAWKRHAYDEAAVGLASLAAPAATNLRARLDRATDLSRAFAAWDRFDHAGALAGLESYRTLLGAGLGPHFKVLSLLTREGAAREPARILDLWRNAERRAVQGRYDDAVARIYRMLEWTAQWLLRTRAEIDTADVPAGRSPKGVELSIGRNGRRQAGLYAAWALVAELLPDTAAAAFFESHAGGLRHRIDVRNSSILAHGFKPVGAEVWEDFHRWLETNFIDVLIAEAEVSGVQGLSPQLPERYAWDL